MDNVFYSDSNNIRNFNKRRVVKKNPKPEKQKEIFIVLTQTKTYFARLIKLYTREPYAHASIAFDRDLETMYSFARLRPNNPFITGFVEEDINNGIFGKCEETTCSVYSLKVTEEQYHRLQEEIEIFKRNREKYSYNFLGIVGVMIHRPIALENRYFCSQFVAYILEQSGIRLFHKSCALVRPFDIRMCSKLKRVYKGKLANYRASQDDLLGGQINLRSLRNA